MDMMKFYDITHREHEVCNPSSASKLESVIELLRLPPGAQVVDIACGKGEFLIRMAKAYDVRGLGIDISPFHIAAASRRLEERVGSSGVAFTVMDGAEYRPDSPSSLDVASCIGASWVFGGHAGTLDTLRAMVKPGGWVLVGEPFWRQEPSPEYLDALGLSRQDFGTHFSNA